MSQALAGTLIEGRYSLGSRFAVDGPVERYFAVDMTAGEPVNVLLFRSAQPPDAAGLDAFNEVAKKLALLSHPGLVEVLSWGEHQSTPYLITSDAEGATLGRMLTRSAKLSVDRALQLLSQTSEALETAHRSGFHHGHLDPNSIVFAGDGRAMVLGVGLEQLTRALDRALGGLLPGDEARAQSDRAALVALSKRLLDQPKVAAIPAGASRPIAAAKLTPANPVLVTTPPPAQQPAFARAIVAKQPLVAAHPVRIQEPKLPPKLIPLSESRPHVTPKLSSIGAGGAAYAELSTLELENTSLTAMSLRPKVPSYAIAGAAMFTLLMVALAACS